MFGGLRGDAAKAGDLMFFFYFVANFFAFGGRIVSGELGGGVEGDASFADGTGDENVGFASVDVQNGADVHVFVAIVFAPSGGNRHLDDVKDGFFGERFFFGDDFDHRSHLFAVETFHSFLSICIY